MSMAKARKMKNGYKELDLGMGEDRVLSLFGDPDSKSVKDGVKKYTWFNREFKGLARGVSIERRIVVEFQDGKVIGYDGQGIEEPIW